MRFRVAAAAFAVAAGICAIGASGAWANSITPICMTDQGGAQPCQPAWYTSPVELSWAPNPMIGATGNCPVNYYDTDFNDTVTCTFSWPQQQTTTTQGYAMHIELSSPTASGVPTRAPDSNGWYNHPVSVAFQGSSFSGIASCTSTTYSGPSSASASVTGTCTDNAGKIADASFALQYDDTPPSLAVSTNPADRSVVLNWQATADVAPLASVNVIRTPGASKARASKVYQGDAGSYDDTRVRNGVRYTYRITAVDQAGNKSVRTVAVTPGPRLLSPRSGARLTAAPLLSWTPVHGASYYNVQLYRGGKVLSTWPYTRGSNSRRTWRFDGRRYRLKPGRYRWYVWPGYGRLAAARYGRLIGSGTFVVTRT